MEVCRDWLPAVFDLRSGVAEPRRVRENFDSAIEQGFPVKVLEAF